MWEAGVETEGKDTKLERTVDRFSFTAAPESYTASSDRRELHRAYSN